MNRWYRAIISLFLILLAGSITTAQNVAQSEDDGGDILRIESAVVFCDVGVRDKQGKSVVDLPADNFIIYEDGKPQNIEHFVNGPGPIDLVLAFDISGSTKSKLKVMQETAINFIRKLEKTDQVAIIQFDETPEVLVGLTDIPILIERAIAQLGGRPGYGSSVFDAMIFAGELVPNNSGRHKAVVMITDGVDNTSRADIKMVKKMLESQSASFYFLDLDTEKDITDNYFGIYSAPFTNKQLESYYRSLSISEREVKELMDAKIDFPKEFIFNVIHYLYKVADKDLSDIADYFGGRVYKVDRIEDLADRYQAILDDLRRLYTIGYYPNRNSAEGNFHKITIKSKRPNVSLSYRRGYRDN